MYALWNVATGPGWSGGYRTLSETPPWPARRPHRRLSTPRLRVRRIPLWLITTNDNTSALRFYQLWGMGLCAFYRHGARGSRRIKPSLPERGADDIPQKHELEFELLLAQG